MGCNASVSALSADNRSKRIRVHSYKTNYFSASYEHPFNPYLLAYITGNDVARLSCSNKVNYTSVDWVSCQVRE